jgi:uncharacterized membrane protein
MSMFVCLRYSAFELVVNMASRCHLANLMCIYVCVYAFMYANVYALCMSETPSVGLVFSSWFSER